MIEHGDDKAALATASKILQRGLMVSASNNGIAAWAYYADMVPSRWRTAPLVVFDVDEELVERCECWLPHKENYAFMKMPGPEFSYIPIKVLGFVNVRGFPAYRDTIGFF